MSDREIEDAALVGRVLWLKHELKRLPTREGPDSGVDLSGNDWAKFDRVYRAAVDKLNHDLLSLPYRPAGIRHTNNSVQLSMLGITANCTYGLVGACRNWLIRAEAILVERNQGMPRVAEVKA